jgi:large subunit ribosomal protein L3
MSLGLIGHKVGMTQVYLENGVVEPVTVVQLGPCPVLQLRTLERDGYTAIQLGFQNKPRKNATRPEQGHVAPNLKSKRKEARQKSGVVIPPKADCEPQRFIREFRLDPKAGEFVAEAKVTSESASLKLTRTEIKKNKEGNDVREHKAVPFEVKVGQVLNVKELFEGVIEVDVIGHTKGRGFQGVMRRHNFDGMPAAHGSKKNHRQAGSTASLASNRGSGRPKKGLKRAGQYGNERVTIRNLKVVKIDAENNLICVRGAVPGSNGSLVMVRPTNMK